MKNHKNTYILIVSLLILVSIVTGIRLFNRFSQNTRTTRVSPPLAIQQSPPSEKLDEERLKKYLTVEAALLGVTDHMSLYLKDLDYGKEIAINSTRSWIPASTIKAFVILEAFRQKRLGIIDFDQTVSIEKQNVVTTALETEEFPHLREGINVTIRQLVDAMIIQSDNTAYNTLLDILDRRNINSTLQHLGITETVVGQKLNLDDDQFQKDNQVAGYQINTTTVKDYATLFDFLYNKKVADAEEILAIFKRQKINDMLPALLPSNIAIAHKPGVWEPHFHDGGVIYKPNDPFILVIFTNSNSPEVIAHLAKVAFYQNADSISVGTIPKLKVLHSQQSTYLAEDISQSNVLAATTDNTKIPQVSSYDLGITADDLNTNKTKDIKVQNALIIPGSLLYPVKRYLENVSLQTAQDNKKADVYIKQAQNRLSEVKTLLASGQTQHLQDLLVESEETLKQATNLAKTSKDKDAQLLAIKQLSDLHYSIFASHLDKVNPSNKEQIIDNVYKFYQKNTKEVAPEVKKSVIADPYHQQPIIGTVKEVHDNSVVLQFQDGSKREVVLNSTTTVRDFDKKSINNQSNFAVDSKVAVIGQVGADQKIIPQFILNAIPKEFPEKQVGKVVEVNPQKQTLKIQDAQGNQREIIVNEDTVLKGKDTNISVEGIKAGSNVAVFGQTISPNSPIPSPLPSPSPLLTPLLTPIIPSRSIIISTVPIVSTVPKTSAPISTAPQRTIPPIISTVPIVSTVPKTSAPISTAPQRTIPPTTRLAAPTSVPQQQRTVAPPTINVKPVESVRATSVTVINNSSGKQEKPQEKTEEKKKPEPPKPTEKPKNKK